MELILVGFNLMKVDKKNSRLWVLFGLKGCFQFMFEEIWGFPKMVVPPKHPKMIIFTVVGKHMVVGYHHFRKQPYMFKPPRGSWLLRSGGSCFNDQSEDFHLENIWWEVCGAVFLPILTSKYYITFLWYIFVFVFLNLTWNWELQVILKVSSCVIHWWDTPLL